MSSFRLQAIFLLKLFDYPADSLDFFVDLVDVEADFRQASDCEGGKGKENSIIYELF